MKPFCPTAQIRTATKNHEQAHEEEMTEDTHEDDVNTIIMDPELLSQNAEDDVRQNHNIAMQCRSRNEGIHEFILPSYRARG